MNDYAPKMPKGAMSYKFEQTGTDYSIFSFTTANGIGYEVRFVPSAYLFEEYIDDPVDAYEMIIAVADNPTGKRLPGDPLIGPTIRAIFYDFFQQNDQVVVFICDDSDRRQRARARKFTSWYYDDMRLNFVKLDTKIPDAGKQIFMSAILKSGNRHRKQIAEVFLSFSDINK